MMTLIKRDTRLLAGAITAIMLLASAGSAQARPADDAVVSPTPGVAPASTPVAMFASLRQAPSRSIPEAVGRAIAFMPSSPGGLVIDPSQVHRADVAGRSFYIASTADGLCVFNAEGSSGCSKDLAAIARFGLGLQEVPPIPGRVDPVHPENNAAPSGPTTVYGVAPDGVGSVAATMTNGVEVDAVVKGNAFVMVTDHPVIGLRLRP
jgi:hypothetical protein